MSVVEETKEGVDERGFTAGAWRMRGKRAWEAEEGPEGPGKLSVSAGVEGLWRQDKRRVGKEPVTKVVVGVDESLGGGGEGFEKALSEALWEAACDEVLDVKHGAQEVAGEGLR